MPSIIKPNAISVEQLLSTLDQLDVYVYIKDIELRYIYVNNKVCAYYDCSLQDIIGAKDDFLAKLYAIADEVVDASVLSDLRVLSHGETIEATEKSYNQLKGRPEYYTVVKQPLYGDQGQIIGLFGVATDITEHKLAEQALQQKEQYLSAILDNVGACIFIKDKSLRFEYINRMTEDTFQMTLQDVMGKNNEEILGDNQGAIFSETDREVFATGDLVTCLESFGSPGNERYYWTVKAPLFDHNNDVERLIGMSTDITSQIMLEKQLRSANKALNLHIEEIEALRAELEESAIRDPLTGLYNRRYLDDFVQKEWSRSERNQHPISVALLDLDRFKFVNDSFGHAAGDKVLIDFSERLNAVARKTDVACRFGGEEFVLLMPGAPVDVAVERAQQFLRDVEAMQVEVGEVVIQVTTSAGVACYPDDANSFEGLVAIADRALYQAKRNGRNQVVSSAQLTNAEK